MKIALKISLIIAVSVAIVAIISVIYGPKNKLKNPSFLVNNDSFEDNFENIPKFLQRSFPNTDFSKADPSIQEILSGGPARDGIPAIDKPKFIELSKFSRSDEIEALVLLDGSEIKVYPYNILTLHEIVNDTVGGVPVAITFCPLCGSAIVYDRRLSVGDSTFGVSGALIDSNMVMYDRATETLWQQSTGKALAGELFGSRLELYPFQLLTIGAVKEKYPDAQILSEDTGHRRDYGRNPYGDYNNDNRFIFEPSSLDERFGLKEIMAVWRVEDKVFATPWLKFEDGSVKTVETNEVTLTLEKSAGELVITDEAGTVYPFFFEMWFSYAVQNPEGAVVD